MLARTGFFVLAALALAACDAPADGVGASVSVAEAMAGDTVGYARADRPRAFAFPADHGPHPAFKTEWWYVTGNLRATDGSGRRFGVQFTVFRSALSPDTAVAAGRASDWASGQLFMAHVALGDSAAGHFYAEERFARGAAGLAGATPAPLRAWLGPVELRGDGPPGGGGAVPLRLAGEAEGARFDLAARPLKPVVLQGDRGLSQKGDGPGNASYYYAQTRMATSGTVTLPSGEAVPVEGRTWLDREWSTSALGADQVGWDWFALHLDDGRDLMVYQLRRPDGSMHPLSKASLVAADGAKTHLPSSAFRMTPGRTWTSPLGGAYPVEWRVEVPGEGLDLRITPMLDAQELDATVRYWEGGVQVRGSHAGTGFLEMTGYADAARADRATR
jgi:predicted secreted hydrolase